MNEKQGSSAKMLSGTGDGLLLFLTFLVEKGYATENSVAALRSAVRQVLSTVAGDTFGDVNVLDLDPDEYMDRFENRALGKYKQESLASYRSRFKKAIDAYRKYLTDKKPPSLGGRTRRPRTSPKAASETPHAPEEQQKSNQAPVLAPPGPTTLIDYPFPLRSGQVGHLRLPMNLDRSDADRLGAFLRTLVLEPQKELPAAPLLSQSDST
jgi:hypothetical protein